MKILLGLQHSSPSRSVRIEPTYVNDNEAALSRLTDAIVNLPDLPKQILALHYSEGLNFAEIAEVFGLSESQVNQVHQNHVAQLQASIRQTVQKH